MVDSRSPIPAAVRVAQSRFHLTIRRKIFLAAIGMSLITAALGAYAVHGIELASSQLVLTFDSYLMSVSYARAAATDFAMMDAELARWAKTDDRGNRVALAEKITALVDSMSEDLDIAATRARSERARRAARRAHEAMERWNIRRLELPPDAAVARNDWTAMEQLSETVHDQIDLLINYAAGDAFIHRERSLATIDETRRISLIGTAGALCLAALITWTLARRIMGPVAAASEAAARIARGELDVAIPVIGADELGALLVAMDMMRDSIRLMVAREIEQRKSAQVRLVDAIETSREGVMLVDAGGTILLANSQMKTFFPTIASGLTPGRPVHDVLDAIPIGAVPSAISESDVVECLTEGRWLRISSGTTTEGGAVTIASDVSTLKERESELKQTNIHFDAALNNMSQGLCLFGNDQRLRVLNRKFCELYGVPYDATRSGMTLRDLVELIARHNPHANLDCEEVYAHRSTTALVRTPTVFVEELIEGRVVTVSHEPMEDGGWVATYEDVTERRRAEAQVAFMAHHDVLTNLPNRVLFQERMTQAITEVKRGRHFAVLCLDLDRFKAVNDTLGHPAGDRLLQVVSDRLRGCVREPDTVARLGGDEFAIIQNGFEKADDTAKLAERIISVISEPYDLDGQQVMIGVSIGIAVAPGDGDGANVLLRNADMALYRAKMDGRGTSRFFEAAMDERAQQRRALELDLRKAVLNQELEVFYQPVVDLTANCVVGFEALVRWRHPTRGMISPGEFIPLAEEVGLIVAIGRWVLQRACMEAVSWPNDLRVAVNVSAVQFLSNDLVENVRDALATSGLARSRLEIEITESVLMQNDTAMTILHRLRGLGVRIAMDDFGTGYSSLSYLRSFPFDKIKIDQSFVRDLSTRKDSEAIVCAITKLGGSLGMRTTAEGVETKEQLQRLREEQCDEVQGYYFSPPRPGSEVPDLIARIDRQLQNTAPTLIPA